MEIRRGKQIAAFGAVYGGLAVVALSQTRFEGGVAFVWTSTALLVARLQHLPVRSWWPYALACYVSGIVATGLFGLGWTIAPLLGLANIAEAVLAAALLRAWVVRDHSFDSMVWLFRFFLIGGVIAPLASGVLGSLPASIVLGLDPVSNLTFWIIGHGVGTIAFAPLFSLAMGDRRQEYGGRINGKWLEFALTSGAIAAICVLVFAQTGFPLLFLPVLAVVVATFRLGQLGALLGMTIVIAVSSFMTVAGNGPIQLIDSSAGIKALFLQFYLSAMVLTVLPVAADLARRSVLFRALRESEARYRVLADTCTDIIMNIDCGGQIRFVSSSIRMMGGYDPEALVGQDALSLVAPEFHDALRAAHARAIANPEAAVAMEYEGLLMCGQRRWFETNSRAIIAPDGQAEGVVSVIRDLSSRKSLETELTAAAMTDPLTGLPNGRAFREQLQAMTERGTAGCVAIFDIDHFKRINDRYGHAAGDLVLASLAQVTSTVLRTSDMFARIGGEEFAMLLPEATPDQARIICGRLVTTIGEVDIYVGPSTIRCTVSCGVAELGPDGDRSLNAADAALYRAKEAGRDRLMMAA